MGRRIVIADLLNPAGEDDCHQTFLQLLYFTPLLTTPTCSKICFYIQINSGCKNREYGTKIWNYAFEVANADWFRFPFPAKSKLVESAVKCSLSITILPNPQHVRTERKVSLAATLRLLEGPPTLVVLANSRHTRSSTQPHPFLLSLPLCSPCSHTGTHANFDPFDTVGCHINSSIW